MQAGGLRNLANTIPQSPSELAMSKGFVAGIMGLPGSFKTSEALTLLPEYGPIALFNLDGGAHVLPNHLSDIQIYTPRDWQHLENMTDEICADPKPFKSIWVDIVTMMQEENIEHHAIYDVSSKDKRERQVRFGDSNWDVLQFHRKLMRAAEQHDINVFFVYWASRPVVVEGSGNPLVTRHIVLSPTVSLKVTGILDIIMYFENRGEFPPHVTLSGDKSVESRVRLSLDNPLKKWKPNFQATPTLLTDMINAFKGEINEHYT